jgi:hypothetical protein
VRWTDETFSFVNRGVVGSFEDVFSDEQKTRFEEKAKAKLGTETFGKHCQSRECS